MLKKDQWCARFQDAWDTRESEHPQYGSGDQWWALEPAWVGLCSFTQTWQQPSAQTWKQRNQAQPIASVGSGRVRTLGSLLMGCASCLQCGWGSSREGEPASRLLSIPLPQPPRLGSISSLRGRKRETESSYTFLSGCLAHWHMSAVVTGWLGLKGDRWFKSELKRKMISLFQAFSHQKDECPGLRSFPHYFYLAAFRNRLPVLFLFPQPETDLLRIKIIFNWILDQFKSSLIISISLGYKD